MNGFLRSWSLPTTGTSGLITAVAIAVTFWAISSNGYYALVSAMGLERGYDEAPLLFSAYYLAWSGIALWTFWTLFSAEAPNHPFRADLAATVIIILAGIAYVTIVLPVLPEVSVELAPENPPEFMFASAWYYVPKTADILFQQFLVAAIILTASRAGFGIWSIAIGMALMFGGYHLTLSLDGFTALYVARFTAAATVFGLALPYIYLRVRSGFPWAYGLHWGFYAFDATVTHFILAA